MGRKALLATFISAAFVFVGTTALAALDANEVALGEALYMDTNLSLNFNQACNSCHNAVPVVTGFVDPDNLADPFNSPVSSGSDITLFGGRNAPAAGYAAFSPAFRWDEVAGLYIGGQFWDGRETNLAGQAAGPFLNPVEMAMPDKWSVVDRLRTSNTIAQPGPDYVTLFNAVYPGMGDQLLLLPPYSAALPTPSGVLEIYDRMAKAIGEFEKTRHFNKFNSKYDYYLAGMGTLTSQELMGLRLFEGKAKCALCHLSQPSLAPDGSMMPPLFTDFTYDNLGVPVNPQIAILAGPQAIDYGLGGRADIAERDPITVAGTVVSAGQAGKFKVMTLRNIEITPPYAHNGFFPTLADIVHFYNTRDVDPMWPAPEVALNVNTAELGNLHLNASQEAALVAFMLTLTDRDPSAFPSPYFSNYGLVTPIPMP